MKKENILLIISSLVFIVGLIVYFYFNRGTAQTNSKTIPTATPPLNISLPPMDAGNMNPDYGDLTADQIKIADRAVGKLLNSSEGITPPMITVVSFEETEFNDGSLGCPKPGMMYTQAIVPGYKIVLEAKDKQYDYHLDKAEQVVLCEQ